MTSHIFWNQAKQSLQEYNDDVVSITEKFNKYETKTPADNINNYIQLKVSQILTWFQKNPVVSKKKIL